jgi:hypothetical protein
MKLFDHVPKGSRSRDPLTPQKYSTGHQDVEDGKPFSGFQTEKDKYLRITCDQQEISSIQTFVLHSFLLFCFT